MLDMGIDVNRGDLLISAITLADDNFSHTVVLICEHADDEGTYGLVLNRPVTPNEEVLESYPFLEDRLFEGGPVSPGVLQVLHPYGDRLADSHRIFPGLWFGADFDELQSGFRAGLYHPSECRFFVGYSGWAKGQLASEFELNTWISVQGNADLVLRTPPDEIWSRAVRLRGDGEPIYRHFPHNPMWN